YLRQEPVSAHAHSRLYRAGKFVRRNRVAVGAGILVAAGLIGATAFSVEQMREARIQRDAAVRERQWADAQVEFQNALLSTVGDEPMTMRQVLDAGRDALEIRYAGNPGMLAPLLLQLATGYASVGDREVRGTLLSRAESLALAGHGAEHLPAIRCNMADNHRMQGEYSEAWRILNAAEPLLRDTPDPENRVVCLDARSNLAAEVGRGSESISAARAAIRIRDSLGQTLDGRYLNLLGGLANALTVEGRLRESVATFKRAIAAMDSSGRGESIDRLILRHDLAVAMGKLGETADAEQILHEVLGVVGNGANTSNIPWQPLIHYAEAALVQGDADSARRYFQIVINQALPDTNLYW
ncbi:MAG: hypothetical protein ACREL6_03480, partial [Gemmatimonadales bacterium]